MNTFSLNENPLLQNVGTHLTTNSGLMKIDWPHQSFKVDTNTGIIEVNADYCTIIVQNNLGTVNIKGSFNRYCVQQSNLPIVTGQMNLNIMANARFTPEPANLGLQMVDTAMRNPFEESLPLRIPVGNPFLEERVNPEQAENVQEQPPANQRETQTANRESSMRAVVVEVIPPDRGSSRPTLVPAPVRQASRASGPDAIPNRSRSPFEFPFASRRPRFGIEGNLITTKENSLIPIIDSPIPVPNTPMEPFECSVCMQECKELKNTAKLQCNHSFHYDCVSKWLVDAGKCPNCRAVTTEVTKTVEVPARSTMIPRIETASSTLRSASNIRSERSSISRLQATPPRPVSRTRLSTPSLSTRGLPAPRP